MTFNPNKFPAVDRNKNLIDNKIVEYKFKREDSMEFKLGSTEVKLKYSSPNLKYIINSILKRPATFDSPIGNLDILLNLRKINDLTFKNSSAEYSVMDILGEGWEVFFWTKDNPKFRSCVSLDSKVIFTDKNPLTPNGILSLAHEVGHFEEEQVLTKEEKKRRGSARMGLNLGIIDKENRNVIIEEERNAWARALNHFRHFSKDLNVENIDIEKVVHQDCLESYGDNIDDLKSVE